MPHKESGAGQHGQLLGRDGQALCRRRTGPGISNGISTNAEQIAQARQCNEVAEILLDGKAETFAADKQLAEIFMRHITDPFCPAFIYTAKHPEALIAQAGEQNVQIKLRSVWSNYARRLVTEDAEGNVKLNQAAHRQVAGPDG